ncbi:LysR family transcriptional regulator [Bradyrhizobium iriomotense]|uniref:LysR family transcriptional regulator n=2 Tax=Bradyrhizobium iriomotense TaxID=441950 RepID=A0ABQ6B7N6_9BRAD|nr:LysR family transcriptional regulator [Bradyrhizobium iriomotense]
MLTASDLLLRRLRMRHFQLLVLLGDLGSLRAAAASLNLTQPAASKMLAEVERTFGAPLFDRGRHGVEPNIFGRSAIRHARVMMAETEHAANELNAMRGGATTVVRVGAPSITDVVPKATVELMRLIPGTCVEIREGRARDLLKLLLDAELDCVLGALPSETLTNDPIEQLQSEVVFNDHICAVVAKTNPLSRKGRASWHDLSSQRWIAPPRNTPVRRAFMAGFLNNGLTPPQPVVEAVSPPTLGALIRLDRSLIGVARYGSARDSDAFPGTRIVEIVPKMTLPPICAILRRTSVQRPKAVVTFVEALKRAARSSRPRAT